VLSRQFHSVTAASDHIVEPSYGQSITFEDCLLKSRAVYFTTFQSIAVSKTYMEVFGVFFIAERFRTSSS